MINPQATDNVVRHIEIKAYVDDYKSLCARVAALALEKSSAGQSCSHSSTNNMAADYNPIDRVQDDTFFHCRSGRLKLRSSGQYHDLIYYRRVKDYGPSESVYQFARTGNPAALRTSLTSAFGEAGRVRKFRRTYHVGRCIVHLDRVSGLGDFIEIKVELGAHDSQNLTNADDPQSVFAINATSTTLPSLSVAEGAQLVENQMIALDVDLFQLVDGAYVDLLNERDGIDYSESANS